MNDSHPNIGTALLLIAIFAAFFAAQQLDMTDHSAEHAQAAEIEQRLSEAEQQRRRNTAAQYACGPNSAYEWISDSTVQCFTTRGRKSGAVEVAAQ